MSIDEAEEKKFRLIVHSAEEAASVIRNKLGENAKVLSVKQVGGKGLTRFLSSPKLEVIAVVPKNKELAKKKVDAELKLNKNSKSVQKAYVQKEIPVEVKKAKEDIKSTFSKSSNYENNFYECVKNAGLDINFLNEKRNVYEGASSFAEKWLSLIEDLKSRYEKIPKRTLGNKVVFLGTPGSGKTSALCKQLSKDVFVNNVEVSLFKMDSGVPKTDESLDVFCKVVGANVLREGVDKFPENTHGRVYVDMPGIALNEDKEWGKFCDRLDQFRIYSRVLVLSAIYDKEFLDRCFIKSLKWGVTHIVFTHLDESNNPLKLWKYILDSQVSPLFFTFGQNLTADYTENITDYLLKDRYKLF